MGLLCLLIILFSHHIMRIQKFNAIYFSKLKNSYTFNWLNVQNPEPSNQFVAYTSTCHYYQCDKSFILVTDNESYVFVCLNQNKFNSFAL